MHFWHVSHNFKPSDQYTRFTHNTTGMSVLDGDKGLISQGGKTATRDIVQFVA